MRTALTLTIALVIAGCGSHGQPTGVGGNGNGGGGGTGPQSYTVTFGPIAIPAGTENTQCMVKRVGNTAPLHVGAIHNVLGSASHHMVVYLVKDTVEQATPFACRPFQDTISGNGAP